MSINTTNCLAFGSAAHILLFISFAEGRGDFYSPSLGKHLTDPFQQVDRCTSTFIFALTYTSNSELITNEPRVPSLSSPNEEWWITTGSFVLLHGCHLG
jgi:hypothetical protein